MKNRRRLLSRSSGLSSGLPTALLVASNVATRPPMTPQAMTAVGIDRAIGPIHRGSVIGQHEAKQVDFRGDQASAATNRRLEGHLRQASRVSLVSICCVPCTFMSNITQARTCCSMRLQVQPRVCNLFFAPFSRDHDRDEGCGCGSD